MSGEEAQRAEDFSGESGPMLREGLHEAAPTVTIWSESGFGGVHLALERDGGAVIKGVGEGSGRVNPLESVSLQRERTKERRACGERMYGRAEIVEEAGQG